MIKSGKINMIIDCQFGSTGKGLIAAYIAENYHIDISVGRLSPNAGHTFYWNNRKYISKLIPVSAIIQPKSTIYLCSGSVIDINILFKEMEDFDIDPDRLIIHPRCAVINNQNLKEESDILTKIGSTLSGSGSARATKILRTNPLAENTQELREFVYNYKYFDLEDMLNNKLNILVETGQGYDLGINSGLSYPYCTSIDITPSAVLADLCIHPSYMGSCIATVRTYPIRVGNPTDQNNNEIGYSGPVYPDSQEITWKELNIPEEYTTVTKRVRRIFTFSKEQYIKNIKAIKPNYIFLNFINYLREEDLTLFKDKRLKKPTHVSYGPYTHQVRPYDKYIIENYYYKQ